MKPELNREYPEPDEPEIFDDMVALTKKQMKPICGHLRRGQHAKPTGCVVAEFRIADDVPAHLRHGVFREPGHTFQALVRFSNSQGDSPSPDAFTKDGVGTARGLAIKLLDVAGTWIGLDPDDGERTLDFLMVDHPVFPFSTPKSYLETIRRKNIPLVGGLAAGAHLALFEKDELAILKTIRGKSVASPLEIQYWSGAPFRLGPEAGDAAQTVKYSAVPRLAGRSVPPAHPEDEHPDYLGHALARALETQEAVFDFTVQIQTDPERMPVENVSIEWDEAASVPIKVATLRIPPQQVAADSTVAADCERRSFNPWHALEEHRPLGGMNRLRKHVYEASRAERTRGAAPSSPASCPLGSH